MIRSHSAGSNPNNRVACGNVRRKPGISLNSALTLVTRVSASMKGLSNLQGDWVLPRSSEQATGQRPASPDPLHGMTGIPAVS
jgi:hypothetical protein